jgi:hypothetical protein
MEICSFEEVHLLTFFDNDEALYRMQEIVHDHLFGENDPKYFGEQLILDQDDNVTGSSNRLLIGSTTLGVNEIVDSVHNLGGLVVAAHIDRESFSLIGQLGFIPEGLALDAVELSARCKDEDIAGYRSSGYEVIRSSDAHFLSDIAKVYTTFTMEAPQLNEMSLAFQGAEGRTVTI